MKQIIISLFVALLLMSPLALNSAERSIVNLPVYHGSLKDPGVIIHEVNEEYYIIEVDGVYYVLVRENN